MTLIFDNLVCSSRGWAHRGARPFVSHGDGELGVEELLKPDRPAPVRDTLADELDAVGNGKAQARAELARAVGREPNDRSVGRALDQLEADGRWLKEGRGLWRRIGNWHI